MIALILRGILIVLGAAAIERFAATFFVFGAFLLWTAISVWRSGGEEADPEGNALIRFVERHVPTTREYHGTKLTVRIDGQRLVTPMLLVMLAIGTTDLLFALDSIPAVFGLTEEAYLVFTANAFALMGLRQLYFMLHGLLDRLIYLSKGLAIILGFIAVKLLLHALHETTDLDVPEISTALSLVVIIGVLVVTAIASVVAVRRDPSLVESSPEMRLEHEADEVAGEALAPPARSRALGARRSLATTGGSRCRRAGLGSARGSGRAPSRPSHGAGGPGAQPQGRVPGHPA